MRCSGLTVKTWGQPVAGGDRVSTRPAFADCAVSFHGCPFSWRSLDSVSGEVSHVAGIPAERGNDVRPVALHRDSRRVGRTWSIWLLALLPWVSSCEPAQIAKPQTETAKPKPVERVPVESSHLKSVGYDAESRILTIEFRDGAIYEYADVPPEIHAGLMNAASHGRYFHRHIRNAEYGSRRIK